MRLIERLRRLARLERKKPRTRLGRWTRWAERGLTVVLVLYGGLHLYPQLLFAHSFSEDGITIYAREALPSAVADRVSEIAELISRSELASADHDHKIFVCDARWLYRLFAPLNAGSFAVSAVPTNSVFVADADLVLDTARSRGERFNERSFSGVAAHEITHGLIRKRLGLLRALRVEDWVSEGYCDFIAREGSFPEREGLELLTSGGSDPSRSFQYFRWRRMVEYLKEVRGLSFDEIVALGSEAERVESETIAALKDRPQTEGR